MRVSYARRGQASPITIVILMAVTIAIGLALFAFFNSIASEARLQQSITATVFSVAKSINATLVLKESDESTAPAVYCYTINITNLAGGQLRFGITLLPVYRLGQSIYFDDAISIVPIHSSTPPGGEDRGLNVRLFYLADSDRDGLVNLVGAGGLSLGESLPSCRTIYSDVNYWDNAVPPTVYADYSDIIVMPDNVEMRVLLDGSGYSYYPKAPIWVVSVGPGEALTIKFVVAMNDPANPTIPIPLDAASLLVTVEIGGKHYVALMLPLAE